MNFWKKLPRQAAIRPTSTSSEQMVMGLRLIHSALAPAAGVVYYPACGYDRSPSDVWPASRIIYADIDQAAVTALRGAGLKAVRTDAQRFDPGPVDILIMLNPEIAPVGPIRFVVPQGLVICNDYHHTATAIRKMPGFELLGLVRSDERHRVIFDRTQPELYWEEVQTDEEFRNAPLSWGTTGYTAAAEVVRLVTGETRNVVAEYQGILAAARRAAPASPDDESIWLTIKGQVHLLTRLPGRIGTTDSLFVFRKLVA